MGAESVRAILEGRKTQTRRVIKPSVNGCTVGVYTAGNPPIVADVVNVDEDGDPDEDILCPYGKVGDRLWVRETWGTGCRPHPYLGWVDGIEYKADEAYLDGIESLPLNVIDDQDLDKYSDGWHSPMFMPRWASRITLEITDIRVERVQDITEADAIAEGVESFNAVASYSYLWNSLNAKRGYPWEKNPRVWVLTFKVVQ